MRRILTYITIFIALFSFAGCHSPFGETPESNNDYIKLYFAPLGQTRGQIADNECESFLSHLDIIIYKVTRRYTLAIRPAINP